MIPLPPLPAPVPVPAAATPQQPGTLLWIGTRTHGEMIAAYRQCEATAAQIAIRASVDDAIARPAGLVRRVVIARPDRAPADPRTLDAMRALYPQAHAICLLGSGCEGERRTGQPWPGIERVYWHQWNQWSIAWLDAVTSTAAAARQADDRDAPAMALVIAARLDDAAPLLDLLQSASMAAVWLRPGQQAASRNAAAIVWDDSAAAAARPRVWQRRLAAMAGGCRPAPRGGTRHLWLVGFPRLHHWNAAQRGGIDLPISKPYDADALRFLLAGRHG